MQLLLIEDDESLIQLLVPALEAQNYRVDVAQSGDRGKTLAETAAYDVILLDVELPNLDGITICQQLRRAGHFTPIVLLTARNSNTDKVLGLESGADDYIVKPFHLEELLARINALLRRENHFLHTQVSNASSDSDLFQDQLSLIWERTKEITFSRIQDLFDVLQTLEKGDLSQTLCERSQRTAHKLAGSLGTFGFEEGSKIAQTLEKTFAQADNVKTCLDLARPLILELHQVVIATDTKLHAAQLKQKQPSRSLPPQKQTVPIEFPALPELPKLLVEDPSSSPQGNSDLSFKDESFCFPPTRRTDAQENKNRGLDYILLVDSDLEFAQTLAHDSGSWKLDFKAVQSVQEAFEVLRDSFPKVLLLNVDLIVDPADWQILKDLCQQSPVDLALVILSEFEGLESRLKALELRADIFLQKPVTSSQLFASVSRSMNFHTHQKVKVLVLDDDDQVTTLLTALLTGTYFQVEILNDPTLFWTTLNRIQPDLLVLDVEMLALDGLRLCQMIRQDFQWSWLPILFLTGHDDFQTLQGAFAAGADDFLPKPINANGFVNRIMNRWQRSQLYRNQMDTDLLTGIANRTGGSRSFSHLLQVASQSSQPLCLAVLDLDHFKQVNDRYGHEEGDRVLREFGEFLKQHCRAGDVLARWGGEEFIIAMLGLNRASGVKRMNEIRKAWRSQTFTSVKGEYFQVSFSGGVAQYPLDGSNFQVLYRTADAALYKAKAAGRNLVLPSL